MINAEFIIKIMNEWAPENRADEWDNVGLLIGDAGQVVHKILVALDVTEAVVNEAVTGGFDFIISHHPLVYNPIKRVTSADSTGRKMIALIKHGIGCFCAHTNLDKAVGGVNDCLAKKIGISPAEPLIAEEDGFGIGRVGYLNEGIPFLQLVSHVKNALNLKNIRFSGNPEKIVKKIGMCGGDGSSSRYIGAAIEKNCDAYITGDLRYHCVQDALESGIALIDITHYCGEIIVIDAIVSRLQLAFGKNVEIFPSSVNGQVFSSM
ncbi:MAG: Nif3-like dinuclear metal center hexameric protein [Defluviitaleaceae bacterium]|nr:Nif3-like dinuclear metal center hexameric protein [Defluviitaleaceae bacterium]